MGCSYLDFFVGTKREEQTIWVLQSPGSPCWGCFCSSLGYHCKLSSHDCYTPIPYILLHGLIWMPFVGHFIVTIVDKVIIYESSIASVRAWIIKFCALGVYYPSWKVEGKWVILSLFKPKKIWLYALSVPLSLLNIWVMGGWDYPPLPTALDVRNWAIVP